MCIYFIRFDLFASNNKNKTTKTHGKKEEETICYKRCSGGEKVPIINRVYGRAVLNEQTKNL